MVNLVRRFRSKPFVHGVPVPAIRVFSRECKSCCHCGSVTIVGGDLLVQSRKYQRFFCDIECANEYKKNHNKTKAYQAKTGITGRKKRKRDEHNQKKQLHAGWKCCSWCGHAFHSHLGHKRYCSEDCSWNVRLLRLRLNDDADRADVAKCCKFCGKDFSVRKRVERVEYCSVRCGKKAAKQRREFWARSNGPSQYIDLDRLVRRDGARCRECNCKVTRYRGAWRPTDASIDHIIPLSKGGWHTWSNVQLMCHMCNSKKCDALHSEAQLMINLQ